MVYLAFFLGMAASRSVLLKLNIIPDLGTVALIVTASGIAGAVALFWAVRSTPLRFLFDAARLGAAARQAEIRAAAGGVTAEPFARPGRLPGMTLVTLIGLVAALCTTISYIPQLKKIWDTGETEDISLTMFLILAGGIALWVVYGVLQGDGVIILANSVSLAFLCAILFFKLRNIGS